MVSPLVKPPDGVRFPDQACFIIIILGVKTLLSTLEIVYLSFGFGEDTKSRRFLLSGTYARGSKRSHTGGKQTDPLSWYPHLSQPLQC